uniref:Uncharacterized protein n=1 Tax=Triticum urartu TaxID=4572 RepID=A0A8R7P0A1_TRIUA
MLEPGVAADVPDLLPPRQVPRLRQHLPAPLRAPDRQVQLLPGRHLRPLLHLIHGAERRHDQRLLAPLPSRFRPRRLVLRDPDEQPPLLALPRRRLLPFSLDMFMSETCRCTLAIRMKQSTSLSVHSCVHGHRAMLAPLPVSHTRIASSVARAQAAGPAQLLARRTSPH